MIPLPSFYNHPFSNGRFLGAALFMVAAFFCSFVWNQQFNLLAGLACLISLTGALVLVLGGSAPVFKGMIAHPALRPVIVCSVALFAWVWVRAFTSDVPSTSILSASFYVIPFLVASITVRLPIAFLYRGVIPGMIAILLFIVMAAIEQVFIDGFAGRIDWPMQDANHLAMIMNSFFLVSLGMMIIPKTRYVGGVFAAFALITILLAASRAGMIALLIALVVFAVLTLPRIRVSRRMMLGVALGIIGVVVAITLLRPAETSAFMNFIRGLSNPMSLHGSRPEIWMATLSLIVDRPLFGYGTGTFLHIYPLAMTHTQINAGYAAHNDVLHLILETGVVGGILYAGLGLSVVFAALLTRHVVKDPVVLVCRNVALAVMTVLAIHAQIEFMMMVVPVLMLFGTALGVFVRTILNDRDVLIAPFAVGQKSSTKISEMMGVAMMVVLLSLSITQTYAQICSERAQGALARQDTDEFLNQIQRSIFYGLDLQASPYYLQASYILSARLSGRGMDAGADDEVRALLKSALVRNPYMSSIYGAQGKLDMLQGRSPEESFKKGLRLEPRNATLRLELLKYYEFSGRLGDVRILVEESRRWAALRGDVAGLRAFLERYPENPKKSND